MMFTGFEIHSESALGRGCSEVNMYTNWRQGTVWEWEKYLLKELRLLSQSEFSKYSYRHQVLVVFLGHCIHRLLPKACILILVLNFCSAHHFVSFYPSIIPCYRMHPMKFCFEKYFSDAFAEEVLFWLDELLLDSEKQCCTVDLSVHLLEKHCAANLRISGLLFPSLIQ